MFVSFWPRVGRKCAGHTGKSVPRHPEGHSGRVHVTRATTITIATIKRREEAAPPPPPLGRRAPARECNFLRLRGALAFDFYIRCCSSIAYSACSSIPTCLRALGALFYFWVYVNRGEISAYCGRISSATPDKTIKLMHLDNYLFDIIILYRYFLKLFLFCYFA